MIYEVSVIIFGVKYYYNVLRFGNEVEVNGVFDLMIGDLLKWEVVDGKYVCCNGYLKVSLFGKFIKVILVRFVFEKGEVCIRIIKIYKNKFIYFKKDDEVIFSRLLGIKCNVIILLKGYEFMSCNYFL